MHKDTDAPPTGEGNESAHACDGRGGPRGAGLSRPGHAAGDTKQDLAERGIIVIFWPPFSPDLNPIERVWHIMKNYIQDNYPHPSNYLFWLARSTKLFDLTFTSD